MQTHSASRDRRYVLLRRGLSIRLLVAPAGLIVVAVSGIASASALSLSPKSLTVYIAPSSVPISTCSLATPAADTYAEEVSSGSNFGTATTLDVRSGRTLVLLPANKRTFVRFDLSSCAIPTTARVLSAQVTLFMSTAPSATRTYRAHRVTGTWGETSLTWGNQPAVAALPTASVATGTTANVSREWDVLADVAAFVAGSVTNHGWRFSDSVESDTGEGRFRSREHGTAAQRPRLVITYYP